MSSHTERFDISISLVGVRAHIPIDVNFSINNARADKVSDEVIIVSSIQTVNPAQQDMVESLYPGQELFSSLEWAIFLRRTDGGCTDVKTRRLRTD